MSDAVEIAPTVAAPRTSTRHRAIAMSLFAVVVIGFTLLVGLPDDPLGVSLTLWLASYCWNVDAPRRSHLRFARDWWPVVVLLVIYGLLRGFADETGLPVHYSYPIRFDEWIGGGQLPTLRFQHAWCGNPCLSTNPMHWYDVVLATCYSSHFIASLTVAGVLWLRDRGEWLRWVKRVVTMWYAGLFVYFVLPTSPPWLASQKGYVDPVVEISGRGWGNNGLHRVAFLPTLGNKVAAMPSLHTGLSALIAIYAIQRLRTRWRWLAALYPTTMALALVYGGDHYVLDCLMGCVTAGTVLLGWHLYEKRREPDPSGSSHPAGAVSLGGAEGTGAA